MKREEILTIAKPILFNTEMVRAILECRKTVNRRLIKDKDIPNRFDIDVDGKAISYIDQSTGDHYPPYYPCRYKPGDYLYVRETWERFQCFNCEGDEYGRCFANPDGREGCYVYLATHYINGDARWHPSIHMPKEAARIFLRVTDVRVDRLQDITEDDSTAEGSINTFGFIRSPENEYAKPPHTAREDFERIWDSTVKPKDREKYGWNANPWVWVIEFERVEVD